MDKSKQLQKIIKFTEQYIEEKAMKILGVIEPRNNESVELYIKRFYNPLYTLDTLKSQSERELKIVLLKKMCHELQNYQAMPRAINFAGNKDNILKITEEKFKGENFDLYEKFKTCIQFKTKENKDNFAWRKYSDGLNGFIKFLQDCNKDELISLLNINSEDICKCELLKKVKGLGPALLRDFLKELCRDDLIKDDVHIKVIGNELLGIDDNESFAKEFIELCNSAGQSPYYVDKIFWLCCTGNFYKHSVIITTMNNRSNFIEYIKGKISKQTQND